MENKVTFLILLLILSFSCNRKNSKRISFNHQNYNIIDSVKTINTDGSTSYHFFINKQKDTVLNRIIDAKIIIEGLSINNQYLGEWIYYNKYKKIKDSLREFINYCGTTKVNQLKYYDTHGNINPTKGFYYDYSFEKEKIFQNRDVELTIKIFPYKDKEDFTLFLFSESDKYKNFYWCDIESQKKGQILSKNGIVTVNLNFEKKGLTYLKGFISPKKTNSELIPSIMFVQIPVNVN